VGWSAWWLEVGPDADYIADLWVQLIDVSPPPAADIAQTGAEL
jgi:hypothetical protein